jgi:5-methylcytosine-specific restriction endonuclease McrA
MAYPNVSSWSDHEKIELADTLWLLHQPRRFTYVPPLNELERKTVEAELQRFFHTCGFVRHILGRAYDGGGGQRWRAAEARLKDLLTEPWRAPSTDTPLTPLDIADDDIHPLFLAGCPCSHCNRGGVLNENWRVFQWKARYAEFQQSDQWRELKATAMTRANSKCERCHQRPASELHHLTYVRVGGGERLDDVIVVCRECHQNAHDKSSADPARGRLLPWGYWRT